MQSIFQQQQEKAEREAEKNRETYRMLIHRLAAKGSLSAADQARLFDTMAVLAIPLHQADTDVKTLVELARLETVISAAQEAADAMPAVTAAIKSIDDEQAVALEAFAQRRCPHLNEQARLSAIIAKRENAEARRNTLREKNRDLLGLADPAAARNQLHICWLAEGTFTPANDGIPTITIESVMAAPADLNGHFAATSQYRFVPTEGQDQADVDRLVALAQEIVETHGAFPRTVQFIAPTAYAGSLNRGLYVNGLTDVQSPTLSLFVALPGQSFDEIAELLSALEKRYAHRISAPIGQDKDTGPEPVSRWRKRRGARREIDPKNLTDEIIVLGLPVPQPESESNGLRVVAGA